MSQRLPQPFMHLETAGGVPVITVTGTPAAMGRSLAERLHARLRVLIQDTVHALCQLAGESGLIDEDGRYDQVATRNLLRKHLHDAEEILHTNEPASWMELHSIADYCELDVEFLLAVDAFNDLANRFHREQAFFTSNVLCLHSTHSVLGTPLLIMSWEVPPYLLPHVLLIRRIPAHGPATLSLTLGGLHTVAGLSAAGIAVASNDLRDAIVETNGLASTALPQLALHAATYEDALAKIGRGRIHGARAIHLLGPGGKRSSLEISGEEHFQLPDPFPTTARVHTNHRLHLGAPADVSRPVRHSRERLQNLAATCSQLNGNSSLDLIDSWFNQKARDRLDLRVHRAEQQSAHPAAVVVLDPANQRLLCHGGNQQDFKALSL